MGIFSFLFVFMQLLLFLPIGVLGPPTKSADVITKFSLTTEQMSIFIKNMNNYISEKCTIFIQSLHYTKDHLKVQYAFENQIEQDIDKMKINELVNAFEEKQQQVEQKQKKQSSFDDGERKDKLVEMNANEFLKEILKIAKEHFFAFGSYEQHLLIIRELFSIAEHFEEKLEAYCSAEKGDSNQAAVFNFGYHNELKWKFRRASFIINSMLRFKYIKKFSLKERFVINHIKTKLPMHESTKIDIPLSFGSLIHFVANMDTFLQLKCGNIEMSQIEKIDEKNELDQCILQLKVSEVYDFFKNESSLNGQSTKEFLKVFLNKVTDKTLLHLKSEKTKSNNGAQNLIELLQMFKLTRFLNEILLKNLDEIHGQMFHKYLRFMALYLYDSEYYIKLGYKFAAAEYVIHRLLEKDFKQSFLSIYYAFEHIHLDIPSFHYGRDLKKYSQENFYGVKLKVIIETMEFIQIIEVMGKFFNGKCSENMWPNVDDEIVLRKCAKKINFAELGNIFKEQKSLERSNEKFFVNLIVGFLKEESLANKQLYPFDMEVYSQIDKAGDQIKMSVLKGLLQLGHILKEAFLNLINTGYATRLVMMEWKISILIETYGGNPMAEFKQALTEAGLIEAMGGEISNLKTVGVPDEEIQAKK